MKVGKLNAAIDAAPKVFAGTVFGKIAFEKGSLKAAIKATFAGRGQVETGWWIDGDGFLRPDPDA